LIVTGDAIQPEGIGIPEFPVAGFAALPANENFQTAEISPDDIVEIVYTSGTTGEPVGVVHRHHNICANLTPIQTEMRKYEKWARPFQPVRILDMLPLSHLFGQSLGIFTPPLLGGAAVFMTDLQAGAIVDTIRRERISVLVSVPKLLINLQREIWNAGGATGKSMRRWGTSSGRWWSAARRSIRTWKRSGRASVFWWFKVTVSRKPVPWSRSIIPSTRARARSASRSRARKSTLRRTEKFWCAAIASSTNI
jgi:long-subunit acyl-CoA synthetase (AMP-forming)